MTDSITVQGKMVVGIHYRLTNDAGEELDTSIGFDHLYYIQGAHNIVPGLENELTGLSVGDKKECGRSTRRWLWRKAKPRPVAIARSNFPPNVEIQTGMMFHTEGAGRTARATVGH